MDLGEFMRSNGIRHIKLAPYHPATNAMTFKQALRAALVEKKSISWKLANFLLAYRSTPHALTGETQPCSSWGETSGQGLYWSLTYGSEWKTRSRVTVNSQPCQKARVRPSCGCPKLQSWKQVGSGDHHSSLGTLVIWSQGRTQYSMATACWSTQSLQWLQTLIRNNTYRD